MTLLLQIIILILIIVFLILLFWIVLILRNSISKTENNCCTDSNGHDGEFNLLSGEELVIFSHPGDVRPGMGLVNPGTTITLPLGHGIGLSPIVPILTVNNSQDTTFEVCVEAPPQEEWYTVTGPPATPPQPIPEIEVLDNLTYTMQYPQEGQPSIDRLEPGAGPPVAQVLIRKIYSIRLAGKKSTTIYGPPSGFWLRVRSIDGPCEGTYRVSWCCEFTNRIVPEPT